MLQLTHSLSSPLPENRLRPALYPLTAPAFCECEVTMSGTGRSSRRASASSAAESWTSEKSKELFADEGASVASFEREDATCAASRSPKLDSAEWGSQEKQEIGRAWVQRIEVGPWASQKCARDSYAHTFISIRFIRSLGTPYHSCRHMALAPGTIASPESDSIPLAIGRWAHDSQSAPSSHLPQLPTTAHISPALLSKGCVDHGSPGQMTSVIVNGRGCGGSPGRWI